MACESTIPPDSDHLSLMTDFSPGQPTLYQDLHDELEWRKDSSETTTNEHKHPAPSEATSFSQYSRFQPPSCSSTKDFGDNIDKSSNSNTVNSSNICLSVE